MSGEEETVSKFGANFDENGEYTGPESLTITFKKPIGLHDADANAVASITLTEPETAQMEAFTKEWNKSQNDFSAGAILIHMNANDKAFTLAHAKKLKSREFQKAIDFLTGFIPPGPKVGATLSQS